LLAAQRLEPAGRTGDLTFQRRPLSYWLDYLRAFAGTDNPVLLIQGHCDTPDDRSPQPSVSVDKFIALQWERVSAKTDLGLDAVKGALKEAVRECVFRHPPPPIGLGRATVRDRLRRTLAQNQARPRAQRRHRWLTWKLFKRLCKNQRVSDPKALLDFLHLNGVLFYRSGLFNDRIILDQNWALEAIYDIFDRKEILPRLQEYGRFSRADLEAHIWRGRTTGKPKYTLAEQMAFLGMMESCGICFKARQLPDNEWEYIAPELLPNWSDPSIQEELEGRLRENCLQTRSALPVILFCTREFYAVFCPLSAGTPKTKPFTGSLVAGSTRKSQAVGH
jgi:internalin A